MTSPTLAAERAYLAAARADLAGDARGHPRPGRPRRRRRLRGVPRGAPAQAGPGTDRRPGDPAVLRPARPRRPATDERFYVGRRHVHDDDGDPVVIDWRADVSTAFYRATRDRADGRRAAPAVRLRARPDHGVRGRAPARPRRGRDAQPRSWPARSSGPASARCATSSPPSSPSRTSSSAPTSARRVCVQGAPGTGKTAVGLHRAAYLLYTFRDRLRRGGVLVVGPNSRLPVLHLRGAAGPRRGGRAAGHARRAGRHPGPGARRGAGPVATLKGDPRMAEVLRRAVYARLAAPTEPLVLPRGSRRWRVPAHELAEHRRRAARTRRPLRRGPRRCSRSGWRTRCSPRWRRPATRPTTGCRTRWRAARRCAKAVDRLVARGRPGADRDVALLGDAGRAGPPRPTASSTDGRAATAALGQAARAAKAAPLDARRRGPRRRGRRPGRPRAEPRPRGARRGAGPLADAAARGRPPLLDGVGHRSRRHRAGHHAVGHHRLGGDAGAPRQAGRAHRGAPARLPGARRRHRVRQPAAAAHRAGRRRARVGAREPTAGSTVRRPSTCVRRGGRRGTPGARRAGARSGSSSPTPTSSGSATRSTRGRSRHVVLGADDAGTTTDRRVSLVPASLAKGLEYDHVVVVEPAAIVAAEPSRVPGTAAAVRRADPRGVRALGGARATAARRAGGVTR